VPPTQAPPAAEPWFALPLADLQAFQNFLQREMISGQEAAALLNKLAQAVPVQQLEG
jgi:hypothetical protein